MERSKAEWQNERKALESQKTQLLLEKQNLLAANQTQKGREKGTEIGRSKSPNRSKGDKGTEIGRSKSPNHGRTKSPSDELKMLVSTDVTKSLLQPPLLPEDASTCSINDSSSAVNFTSEGSLESSMIEVHIKCITYMFLFTFVCFGVEISPLSLSDSSLFVRVCLSLSLSLPLCLSVSVSLSLSLCMSVCLCLSLCFFCLRLSDSLSLALTLKLPRLQKSHSFLDLLSFLWKKK